MKIFITIILAICMIFMNFCCDSSCEMGEVGVDRFFRFLTYLLWIGIMVINLE